MENIGASFFIVFFIMAKFRFFLSLIILTAACFVAKAQLAFSDSVQISLLTCSEGPDAYERFGHSAVRINDLKSKQDIVFHWGVFDFNAPHFVYRFVKGETDYQIGASYTSDFINQYYRRGLAMKEQVLNLDRQETDQAISAILENYRPENRTYRYSFFFDNCATRPFNVINKASEGQITYDTAWVQPLTLRDMVQLKSGHNNWLDFGISLAVAGRSDHQAWFKEQMFLPEFLSEAYNHATIGDKQLVKEERMLLKMDPEVQEKIQAESYITSPQFVCWAIFILFLVLWRFTMLIDQEKSEKEVKDAVLSSRKWVSFAIKTFESIFLFVTGITGAILYFLNFISVHPAVDHNVNCLWLIPTNIIFAVLIWVKSAEKVNRIYFFIIFALIIAYAIINACVRQYINPAFGPLLFTMICICAHQNQRLLYWRKK